MAKGYIHVMQIPGIGGPRYRARLCITGEAPDDDWVGPTTYGPTEGEARSNLLAELPNMRESLANRLAIVDEALAHTESKKG